MSCLICDETMKFVFKDGQGKFICPSCEHEKEVEHVEVKL